MTVMLLDGGIGTEIFRRGVPSHPLYWSAMAHMTHPVTVLSVHCDYLRAGASVITTNTTMAAPHVLAAGNVDDFATVNRRAVALAKDAKAQCGGENVIIAGSLSTLPALDRADDAPRGHAVSRGYREQAEILADAGVDVLLVEMLYDSESAAAILTECCRIGLPVWAGMSAMTIDSEDTVPMTFRQPGKLALVPHETLESLVKTVTAFPITVAGIMHTRLLLMESALSVLNKAWRGALMAYANVGVAHAHDWCFETDASFATYADYAHRWVARFGVSIVGGCCGTEPRHIKQLETRLAC